MDAVGWNLVIGERVTDDTGAVWVRARRSRIVDEHRPPLIVHEAAEVAAALRQRRHGVPVIHAPRLVSCFPACKEERTVAAQRTTKRSAVLVAIQPLVFGRR